MVKEGSAEYKTPFLYDVEAGSFSIYDQNQDQGLIGLCCDNEGHVFGASPSDSPAREWSIRVGQYWYSLTQILKQHYNIDFNTASGFENSGTPIALNVEGTKIAVFVYKGESYILEMPQSLVELTNEIDLLANYSVSPEEGSQFSALKSLSLTFDRDWMWYKTWGRYAWNCRRDVAAEQCRNLKRRKREQSNKFSNVQT